MHAHKGRKFIVYTPFIEYCQLFKYSALNKYHPSLHIQYHTEDFQNKH